MCTTRPTYRAVIRNTARMAPYGDGEVMASYEANNLLRVIAQVELWMQRNIVDGGKRPAVQYSEDGEPIPEEEIVEAASGLDIEAIVAAGATADEARDILDLDPPM